MASINKVHSDREQWEGHFSSSTADLSKFVRNPRRFVIHGEYSAAYRQISVISEGGDLVLTYNMQRL